MIVVLLSSMGFFLSCASKGISEKPVSIGDNKEVPGFYLNPPISDDVFYGVGSAKMKKLNTSRKASLTRARDDIAFQISAQVQSAIVDYYQESGEGDETQALVFYESISRQITNIELAGTKTEKVVVGTDGTLYALISYPKEHMLKSAEEAFIRNEDAAFSEFKAQEALKRLDAQINNNPTTAGENQ